jgi:hypothetical protein
MSTEACRDTGNSGFVIVVGSENEGIATSTRSSADATGRSPGTGGCGISAGAAVEDATVPVSEGSSSDAVPVQALASTTNTMAIKTARLDLPGWTFRDPPLFRIVCSSVVVTVTTMTEGR